jgi:hypothetical protein
MDRLAANGPLGDRDVMSSHVALSVLVEEPLGWLSAMTWGDGRSLSCDTCSGNALVKEGG